MVKRLQHQEDWSEAFSYHGADFEVSTDRDECVPMISRSLRAFGFDSLAGVMFRALPTSTESIPLDLAWRTSQWNLPAVPAQGSNVGAELYRTLRSVHTSTDASHSWSVTNNSIRQSLRVLGQTGLEDMTGIRDTVRALLCLREVKYWYSDLVGLVETSRFESDKWTSFKEVPAGMQ